MFLVIAIAAVALCTKAHYGIEPGVGNFWIGQFPDHANLVKWDVRCEPECAMCAMLTKGGRLFKEDTERWVDESGLLDMEEGPFYFKVISITNDSAVTGTAELAGYGPPGAWVSEADWFVGHIVIVVVLLVLLVVGLTCLCVASTCLLKRRGLGNKGEYGSVN